MKIEECPSPNFDLAPQRVVKLLVVHATETSGIKSPKNWLCDPKAQASAHWLIGRDGRVIRMVDTAHIAWHAGVSKWQGLERVAHRSGKPSVNHCSVGYELVNLCDGAMPYPPAQLAALAALVAADAKKYGLGRAAVVGHEDVSPVILPWRPEPKPDPGPMFPWQEFDDMLQDLGVPA
jgi:N-acetylmuramoyl-L-alanine amidase